MALEAQHREAKSLLHCQRATVTPQVIVEVTEKTLTRLNRKY